MDERVKKLWTGALRSGQHQQGHGQLRLVKDGVCKDCCLGVLCELYRQEHPTEAKWAEPTNYGSALFVTGDIDNYYLGARYMGFDGSAVEETLPEAVRIWAGLDYDDPLLESAEGEGHYASEWNDGMEGLPRPATFTEIADMIERSL